MYLTMFYHPMNRRAEILDDLSNEVTKNSYLREFKLDLFSLRKKKKTL